MEPPMDIQARMREIIEAEAAAIRAVRIDDAYEQAVRALESCEGKVLTTGIGKAGHLARRFAATLSSTGTPAYFIHPAEAAHGDMGMVAPKDCIIAFSTSGKSREVLEMLELSHHMGRETIIGITSHPDAPMRELCDIVLDMGVITEPCSLGLTPSASIAVMQAISDALALALMDLKGVTKHDYGIRHHGGYLGRAARTDNE